MLQKGASSAHAQNVRAWSKSPADAGHAVCVTDKRAVMGNKGCGWLKRCFKDKWGITMFSEKRPFRISYRVLQEILCVFIILCNPSLAYISQQTQCECKVTPIGCPIWPNFFVQPIAAQCSACNVYVEKQ